MLDLYERADLADFADFVDLTDFPLLTDRTSSSNPVRYEFGLNFGLTYAISWEIV